MFIFWICLLSIVLALYALAAYWPGNEDIALIDYRAWLNAYADRVQEMVPEFDRSDAIASATASWPTMHNEDPAEAADIEMLYWD